MPDSYDALGIAVLALFPGALYLSFFERAVGGRWGANRADRVTRFLLISALYHVAVAPVTFKLYHRYVVLAPLREATHLPWTLWLALCGYLAVPCCAGALVGRGVDSGRSWVRPFVGRTPQPRAWDFFWAGKQELAVRLRLKTGTWVGGIYGEAGGRPPVRQWLSGARRPIPATDSKGGPRERRVRVRRGGTPGDTAERYSHPVGRGRVPRGRPLRSAVAKKSRRRVDNSDLAIFRRGYTTDRPYTPTSLPHGPAPGAKASQPADDTPAGVTGDARPA